MSLKLTKMNQTELLESALEPTGSSGWRDDAVAFGVKGDGDTLTAVAVFQGFGGNDAEFHFAKLGDGSITRGHIEAFSMIAFHHRGLGLKKVWAQIAAHNKAAQRAAVGLGFDFEYRKRAGLEGGEDAIVFSMSRQEAGLVTARPQT